MKKITLVQVFFTLLMYAIGTAVLGITLYPSLYLIFSYWSGSADVSLAIRVLGLSFWIVFGYFLFGIFLIFTASLARIVLGLEVTEGTHKVGSSVMLKWMMSSALIIAVRFVFMEFMLLTPFASLFFKLMGAKLGENVQINSMNVGDIPMLEIGDNSVIGGNATVICHLFEKRGLTVSKVKIGKNVIVGLNSVVMPGVEIGDNAVVAPGVIVPKYTKIEPRTVYYGEKKA